jgi:hypothetical protein
MLNKVKHLFYFLIRYFTVSHDERTPDAIVSSASPGIVFSKSLSLIFLIFFLNNFFPASISAQTPAQMGAFQKLTRLELGATKEILSHFQRVQQDKPLTDYLLNYADFLEVFISGDTDLWEVYRINSAKRLKRISGYEIDEYYYYSIWNIHLHNAFLRVKFGDNIRAGISIYNFYKVLEESVSAQPENFLNLQGKAFFEVFFGMVPNEYLWFFRLAGFRGDYDKGIEYFNTYANLVRKVPGFFEEARLFQLIVLLQLENKPEEVVKEIESRNDFSTIDSPSRFLYALSLIKTGNSEKAINILRSYRPEPLEYEIVFMRFLLGEVLLYRGEKGAGRHFEYFLQNYKGIDYRKSAWHRLAMYYLIEENTENFRYCLKNIQTDGSLLIDPDKQAFSELSYLSEYHLALLKSRLRFDGGYYTQAMNELSGFNPKGRRQELEFLYRMGRIYHKTGNLLNANVYYHKVIDADRGSGYYFAANSALLLGEMYASNNEEAKATEYFRLALRLNQGEYKRSIDFQSRRGLKILKSPL